MRRMIAFGPVPSRRLGHSLGINTIPPKICTYSCVYCQLGRTKKMQVERRMFYNPQKILRDVQDKVKKVKETGDPIDYLTFVPDGEPTLDINLAYEIDLLKSLGIKIADLLARLRPDRAYLSIPTRPPAEEWAQPPPEEIINQAYHILHERIDQVEYLVGYEGNDFAFTGNVEEDLLSITAVHPMREEAVSDFLARAGADWSVMQRLIDRGQLIETKYKGRKFYMRRLPARYTG
jgi:wyosine [tRNA(Phe)-imidazoG37] synthetase (radical SAM superfamily)